MVARTTAGRRDVTAELAYLTRALKAPTMREAVERLAERARTETWSYGNSWQPVCNGRSRPRIPRRGRAYPCR